MLLYKINDLQKLLPAKDDIESDLKQALVFSSVSF